VAHQALPPGAVRRRAVFGLLDADGWGWAGLKAAFWFLFIIFMVGYIPNLAYYFTVSQTIDVGYNAVSIVNWCPTANEDLPCPAPPGSTLPWQTSPPELALPQARTGASIFQSGTHLYLVGGSTAEGPSAETLATDVSLEGNFAPWRAGPALPEPRSHATLASYVGVPYLIGGVDASGQPTDTVFMGVVEEGRLTGWKPADGTDGAPDLRLPVAVSGAGVVAATNGLIVLGGRTADGLSDRVFVSKVGTTAPPRLGAWEELGRLPLPEPRADAATVAVGETIYVAGGEGPDGPTRTIFRLQLADGEPVVDEATGDPLGWATAPESQQLPGPRARASAFTANSALYVIGGVDGTGAPQATALWSVPSPTSGDIPEWQTLEQTQLPEPRAGAPVATVGSTAFLIGGETADGPTTSSVRAALSPMPPFFRLGLFGMTIPAMGIEGEIGQQLGYINAFTVGMVNFAILVLIGLAFSHRATTLRIIARLSGGRLKVPAEDRYRT
jgi:N-acetylneuraminic acid mutarotase